MTTYNTEDGGFLVEDKLLDKNRISHTTAFDDRTLSIEIPSSNLPLTTYNCIMFNGPKIIAQIYLDFKIAREQLKLKESNVNN